MDIEGLIKGMSRMGAKILFNKEEKGGVIVELNQIGSTDMIASLLKRLVYEGEYNKAEDILFNELSSNNSNEMLLIAVDFYNLLLEKSDEELEKGNFSREEIYQGLEDIKRFIPPLQLEAATKEHFDFIYYVKKVTLKEHIEKIWGWEEEYQQKDFREGFIPQNNKIIVLNEESIGYMQTNEDNNRLWVVELEILPQFQRMGIGSSIIKNIVDDAHDAGKKVQIGCFKINTGAKRLYERLGFKVIEETTTHYILEN